MKKKYKKKQVTINRAIYYNFINSISHDIFNCK